MTICEICLWKIKHHPLPLTFNQTHSWSRRYALRRETGTMIRQSHAAWHSRTWIYAGGWTRSRRLTSANSPRTRRVSRGRRNWCRSYRPRCVCFILVFIWGVVFRVTQVINSFPATSGTAVQKEVWGCRADAAGEVLRVGETPAECEREHALILTGGSFIHAFHQ